MSTANDPLWMKNFRGGEVNTPTEVTTDTLPTGYNDGKSFQDERVQQSLNDIETTKGVMVTSEEEPSFMSKVGFGWLEAKLNDDDALMGTTYSNVEKWTIAENPRKAVTLGMKPNYADYKEESLWSRVVGSESFSEAFGVVANAAFSPSDSDWIELERMTGSEETLAKLEDEYMDKYFGKGWADKTPEERRQQWDKTTEGILAEQYPDIVGTEAAHSFAAGLGNVAIAVRDPLTYVAPAANSYKAAAAIGASYTAIDNATKQLADKGFIDKSELAIATATGAIGGPAVRGTLKGGGKVINKLGEKARIRAATPILNKYEQFLNDATKHGGDWNEATLQARLATGTDGPTIQKLYEMTGRTFNMDNLPTNPASTLTTLEQKASNGLTYRMMTAVGKRVSKGITPVIDLLDEYSPRLAHALRANDAMSSLRAHTSIKATGDWLSKVDTMSKADQLQMKKAIMSGTKESFKEAETLMRKYMASDPHKYGSVGKMTAEGGVYRDIPNPKSGDFMSNWRAVRKELRKTAHDLQKSGHEMELIKHYFPRVPLNSNKLGEDKIRYMSWRVGEAAKKKGKPLNEVELAEIFKQASSATRSTLKKAPLGGNLKARKIPELNDFLEPHYASPAEALHSYFRTASRDIERANFLNKFTKNKSVFTHDDKNSAVTKAIDAITDRNSDDLFKDLSHLDDNDLAKVADLLNSRFTTGEQSPHQFIQTYKNLGYIQLLGNPLSALTQLGDQAFAVYKSGIRAYTKAMFSPKLIDKDQLGLSDAMEELFANQSKSKTTLNFFLEKSGFNKLDKFGKDMILNSSFYKYEKLAKSKLGRNKIREKWGKYFEGETEDLIRGLRGEGIKNDNVKLLLWHELADVQPIALSEMPEFYLKHPNARLVYMLKSFTIKQLSFMKREFLQDFADGHTVRATRNLTMFSGAWLFANGTADMMKDFVKGDHEKAVTDNMAENFLQMVTGVSKYNLESGMRDGPFAAFLDLITPPIPFADDLAKSAVTQDPLKALKVLPFGGNIIFQNIKNHDKRATRARSKDWK